MRNYEKISVNKMLRVIYSSNIPRGNSGWSRWSRSVMFGLQRVNTARLIGHEIIF